MVGQLKIAGQFFGNGYLREAVPRGVGRGLLLYNSKLPQQVATTALRSLSSRAQLGTWFLPKATGSLRKQEPRSLALLGMTIEGE